MRRILLVSLLLSALTLPEARSKALKHPELEALRQGVRVAEARYQEVGLRPPAILGVFGEEVPFRRPRESTRLGLLWEEEPTRRALRAKEQDIWDAERAIREALWKVGVQQILAEVETTFYTALLEEERTRIAERLAKLAEDAVITTEELRNVGQASPFDELNVKALEARLRVRKEQAEAAFRSTLRRLGILLGEEVQSVEGDLPGFPQWEWTQLLEALDNAPLLRVARLEVERARRTLDFVRATAEPGWGYRVQFAYAMEQLENGRRLGPQWGLEFFRPLPRARVRWQVEAARADLLRAEFSLNALRIQLKTELTELLRELEQRMAWIRAYEKEILPRLQEAWDFSWSGFQQMRIAYPTVLIAEREYLEALEEYLEHREAFVQAFVEIRRILGWIKEGAE